EIRPLNDKGQVTINPSRIALQGQPFAYRFKLTDKQTGEATYHTDSGLRTEHEKNKTLADNEKPKYVVVLRDRAPVTNPGGTILHLMPDSHNIGYDMKNGELVKDTAGNAIKNEALAKQALEAKRNHFNQYGGNIAGIIADITEMKKKGYDFILTTPIFGGDERSSHGYWITNPFQMTQKNGTLEDFKTLIVELFKNGMSLIADGAFVNEGMEGYRIAHIRKWGKESPYYNNFRIEGNMTIANLPNVDPASKEGKEILPHIKLNIVNGNNKYSFAKDEVVATKQPRDYKQPTYVQIYDERLLTDKQKEQVKKGELLTSYGKLTTGNHYEINTNNHSTLLIPFEIPEDEIAAFEKSIKENEKKYNENRLAFLQTVLRFKNFNIDTQANGIENWDGNVDIAKLRYTYSMGDEQKLTRFGYSKEEKREVQQGAYQNQDHIQTVGKYWTKLAQNAIIEHSAKELNNDKDSYKVTLGKDGKFPPLSKEVMTDEVIENVIKGKYIIPQLSTTDNVKDRLAEDLMNLPLESLGFSHDITAVLGSPFISKKAFTQEDVAKTRYQFYQDKGYLDLPDKYSKIYGDAEELYFNEGKSLTEFAYDVVSQADTEGRLISKKDGKLTDAGKLILPLVAHDILKFAMVKVLAPSVKIENKDGKLIYDEEALKNTTLKNIAGKGIAAKSPADEAKQVIALIRKGLPDISPANKQLLADSIQARFKGVKESDIKMAYVLVDRTASGLNWRTDATKDTAPIGEVRDGLENFGDVMDESARFWKGFAEAVKKENPNSYIIAEMTDTVDLIEKGPGRHNNNMSLESNFIHETGVSGLSNYTYFFSSIAGLVASKTDSGNPPEFLAIGKLVGNIIGNNGWTANKGFLFGYSQDGVKTSHNFAANHDKPRLLSILALDNTLFHGQKPDEKLEKKYTPDIKNAGLTPNYKAIAMAKVIDEAIVAKSTLDLGAKEKLQKAVKDLAQGKFQGKEFNPEAFGVSPIDFAINDVIAQAKVEYKLELTEPQEKDLFNKTFEAIMQPALDKMLVIDKIMAIMPGRNTSYAGDEYAATGYESPCKNLYAQNRNVAHREWINGPDKKEFINKYYTDKKNINNLRSADKGLSALSKGETVMLHPLSPLMSEAEKAKLEAMEKDEEKKIFLKNFEDKYNNSVLAMFRYDKVSELICIAHSKNIQPKNGLEYSVDSNIQPEIEKIDLTSDKDKDYKEGTVVAGLAGGLALGTFFLDARKQEGDETVFGVCKENGKNTLRKFATEHEYAVYAENMEKGIEYDLNKINNIKLPDNIMILKKEARKAAKKVAKVAFGSNQNHIKIQAYLNSKQYLNTNQRNAI
ncbi:MAG: alpha-amylase family glycosyl hydrolase, partial [bacterium]